MPRPHPPLPQPQIYSGLDSNVTLPANAIIGTPFTVQNTVGEGQLGVAVAANRFRQRWDEYYFDEIEDAEPEASPTPVRALNYSVNSVFPTSFEGVIENTNDVWATEDETSVPSWFPHEIKKKKVKESNVVVIDIETMKTITDITNEMIDEYKIILKNVYANRLDLINELKYNDLISSYTYNEDELSTERYSFIQLENTITNYDNIINSKQIMTHRDFGNYFSNLEKRAKSRYDIEYSVYKYYPRLKSNMKYSNAGLLSKILTVTQLGKGRVVCK